MSISLKLNNYKIHRTEILKNHRRGYTDKIQNLKISNVYQTKFVTQRKEFTMKGQIKGFIKGVIFTLLIITSVITVSAITKNQNAVLNYCDIKICIDGNYITPKDANGTIVEPFAINGTTYLPVRAVASALGKEVAWDGETSTVFLGHRPGSNEGDGSRKNPFNAASGVVFDYNRYSFEPTHQLKLTSTNIVKGEAGSILVAKASSANKVANANQEWIFFDFQLSHISSSDGEDSIFEANNLISEDVFYKPDGSKLVVADDAYFSSMFDGYDTYDVDLYPGGSSRVIYAILTEKYDGDILLKIPYNNGKNTHWLKLNSETNVITSASALDSYLKASEPEAAQGVKITLKTSLPTTIRNENYSGKTEASFNVTAFEYTSSSTSATITFSGEKTYDSNGAGQSRPVKIGWKLYDSEGYVIDDGTAYGSSIKQGEKFKNCTSTIYSLEPGSYTLEIMSVN